MTQTCDIHLPKIVFFGGKGGVGKTTLAAATAVGLAESGQRTLLVSTDPAHSIGDLLDLPLNDTPMEVRPQLHVRELDPENARDAYIGRVKDNIRRFAAPEFLQEAERQVDLSGQHPGVMESALFEALCQQLDTSEEWDRIVVDTAPTGHALHLLSLPESMQAWTEALLNRQEQAPGMAPEGAARWRQARELLEARRALFERSRLRLRDSVKTGFVLVVNDDRLSVREAVRARDILQKVGVSVPALVVNRVGRATDQMIKTMAAHFPQLPILTVPARDPVPQGLDGLASVTSDLRRCGLLRSG
jgi:arsenite-transporting ATPase